MAMVNKMESFIHIDDLIDILIKGSFIDSTKNKIFNIGGGNDLSMKDVISAVARKYGVNVKHVPWPKISLFAEHGDILFNSNKLDKLINYKYKNDFFEWLKMI